MTQGRRRRGRRRGGEEEEEGRQNTCHAHAWANFLHFLLFGTPSHLFSKPSTSYALRTHTGMAAFAAKCSPLPASYIKSHYEEKQQQKKKKKKRAAFPPSGKNAYGLDILKCCCCTATAPMPLLSERDSVETNST